MRTRTSTIPPLLEIPPDQLRLAARCAWRILSVALGLLLCAALAVPESRLFALAPVCERKARTGQDCPLCGMTHAFVAISRGRFDEAGRDNRGSLPLYAAIGLNEVLLALSLVHGGRRGNVHAVAEGDELEC